MQRPKHRREWVPLERLTLDQRFQLRTDLPPGMTYHEPTVLEYLDRLNDGAEFPPLEAVEVNVARSGKKRYKLFLVGGFHRAEMYRRAGTASVEVLIYPGTLEDCEFYALSQNSRETVIPRTTKDKQAAFARMMDTPHLLQRVRDLAKTDGGLQRVMARALGVSKTSVTNYLKTRGLHINRAGDLEDIPEVDLFTGDPDAAAVPVPEPDAADDEPEGDDTPSPAPSPEVQLEDIRVSASLDALNTATAAIRSLRRQAETILKGPFADAFRAAAHLHGVGLGVAERDRRHDINDIALVKVEIWPVTDAIARVLADLGVAAHQHGGRDAA